MQPSRRLTGATHSPAKVLNASTVSLSMSPPSACCLPHSRVQFLAATASPKKPGAQTSHRAPAVWCMHPVQAPVRESQLLNSMLGSVFPLQSQGWHELPITRGLP